MPALVGAHVVLPLTDGRLVRVPWPLPNKATAEVAGYWRAKRADPGASGHALPFEPDRLR